MPHPWGCTETKAVKAGTALLGVFWLDSQGLCWRQQEPELGSVGTLIPGLGLLQEGARASLSLKEEMSFLWVGIRMEEMEKRVWNVLTAPQTPFRPLLVCFPAVSRLRSILLKVKPG